MFRMQRSPYVPIVMLCKWLNKRQFFQNYQKNLFQLLLRELLHLDIHWHWLCYKEDEVSLLLLQDKMQSCLLTFPIVYSPSEIQPNAPYAPW